MGQKVHPVGIRLGIIKNGNARWFPQHGTSFAEILRSDIEIRKYIMQRLPEAANSISQILIDRFGRNVKITIKTSKPGGIIGKKGEDIEKVRKELIKKVGGANVTINIEEVRKPELEARLVAESVAQQLERRIMFRRAMKRAVTSALKHGAKGIKICVSGRLGGADIARSEWYREGRVPLHTFRADIDYATAAAKTTYGIIGVKVWIYKGEVLGAKQQDKSPEDKQAAEVAAS